MLVISLKRRGGEKEEGTENSLYKTEGSPGQNVKFRHISQKLRQAGSMSPQPAEVA